MGNMLKNGEAGRLKFKNTHTEAVIQSSDSQVFVDMYKHMQSEQKHSTTNSIIHFVLGIHCNSRTFAAVH